MPLLTFLRGSVTVDITGVSVERFLNLAAHRGVNIWNVSPVENGLRFPCPTLTKFLPEMSGDDALYKF